MLKTVGFPLVRAGDQTIQGGSLIVGTAGKGIDFSANTHAAGMTSEVLTWFEQGTWTPANSGMSVTSGSFAATGTYTRVGNIVYFSVLQTSGTVAASATVGMVSGLPFTPAAQSAVTVTNSAASIGGAALVETNGIIYTALSFTGQTGLRVSGFYRV